MTETAKTSDKLRVVLVDDHAVVREGYRRLLERTSDIQVVAEAANGEDAYRLICDERPDVAVLDISLPGLGGIEVTRRVISRLPNQKILMFSMHEDTVFSSRALQAGARGYVTKSAAPEVLIEAVRLVAAGKLYISQEMAQELAMQMIPGREKPIDALSAREFEVFRLLVAGHTLQEISEIMHLSYKTVANYQSSIRQKLDVTNTAQVVRVALNHGLVANISDEDGSGLIADQAGE